jgi:hypothetical protein
MRHKSDALVLGCRELPHRMCRSEEVLLGPRQASWDDLLHRLDSAYLMQILGGFYV